jgi:hypothetical protein
VGAEGIADAYVAAPVRFDNEDTIKNEGRRVHHRIVQVRHGCCRALHSGLRTRCLGGFFDLKSSSAPSARPSDAVVGIVTVKALSFNRLQ